MKLTLEGLKNKQDWEAAGIKLPSYDIEKVAENTKKAPVWVHFGAGNIFRIFIGGLADALLEKGEADKGITCVETFDFDVVDKIYEPYDNLVLAVTLKADGSTDKKVLGSLTEAIKAQSNVAEEWNRLKEIFVNPALQIISFTITEKGYALKGADGNFFPFIQAAVSYTHLAFLATAMVAGTISGCSGQDGEGKLVKISVCVSNQTPAAKALEEVLKPMIEEKTDGKYNIQIYNSGVLGSEKVTYDYTRNGIIEMCVIGTPMWSETPKMAIPDFPFVFRDVEHARRCYQGELADYIT